MSHSHPQAAPSLWPPAISRVGTALALAAWLGACAPAGDDSAKHGGAGTGNVQLTITSPQEGDTLPSGPVEVRFAIENYPVGKDSASGKGPHVHVILDNEPYEAHYDLSQPWVFENLAPGTHTVRAFPSRQWHESIKDPGAFAMVTFHVERADGQNAPEPGAPLLTYSRPKGEYAGAEADSIMFDFWIKNAELGAEAYRVRLTVDNTTEELLEWRPIWKTDLQDGEHTVEMQLIGPDRNPVPGPFNHTRRTITVRRTPS